MCRIIKPSRSLVFSRPKSQSALFLKGHLRHQKQALEYLIKTLRISSPGSATSFIIDRATLQCDYILFIISILQYYSSQRCFNIVVDTPELRGARPPEHNVIVFISERRNKPAIKEAILSIKHGNNGRRRGAAFRARHVLHERVPGCVTPTVDSPLGRMTANEFTLYQPRSPNHIQKSARTISSPLIRFRNIIKKKKIMIHKIISVILSADL